MEGDTKKRFSTDRQVAALAPMKGQVQTEYHHATEPGLIIRVGVARKAWVIQYVIDGKRSKYTLEKPYPDKTLAEAMIDCKRIRSEANQGIDPLSKKKERKDAPTIQELMERYFKEAKLLPKGRAESLRISNKDIIPTLGDMKAMDIRRQNVKDLHHAILNRGAAVAANRTVELLRRAYRHAHEEEMIPSNPFPALQKIKAPEVSRDRTLKDGEIKELWQAMETDTPIMRDVLRLLLLLGQRSTDTMSMRVADIDQARREWTVPAPPRAKNQNPNILPLPPMAWEIIEPRLNKGPLVFPSVRNQNRLGATGSGCTTSTKEARRRLREATGIEGWTGHDLRRTCRTIMAREGIKPHIAERVLGHVQGGIEATYDQHSYLDEKAEALRMVERYVRRILGMSDEGQGKIIMLRQAR